MVSHVRLAYGKTRHASATFFIMLLAGVIGIAIQPVAPALANAGAQQLAQQAASAQKIAWIAFDGGGARSGDNTAERHLNRTNVHLLTQLWKVALPAVVDSSIVEQPGVTTPSGVHDLLFVTTTTGSLLALDAHSGALIWRADHPAGSCKINNGSQTCYTTSSPAIDPSGQYVYTYGLDGYLHKHNIATGTEVTGGGWPELITLKPFDEKESSAINIGQGYLYVTTGGYPGDNGDYQGHVVAINLATGAQTIFNTVCTNQAVHFVEKPGTPDCPQVQSAVWGRGGAVIDTVTGDLFIATGNGTFNAAAYDFGDSVMKLDATASGANGLPLDSYTPTNYQQLQNSDTDLGSTAPVLLPQQPTSETPYMALQIGKDGIARLLNRANLSGQGGPGHTGGELQQLDLSKYGEVLPQPAVWTDGHGVVWIFIANANGLTALRLTTDASGHSSLSVVYHNSDAGSSPFVAGNVLYVQGPGTLLALNPKTGATLWSAQTGSQHWQSPLIVNGMVFAVNDSGSMYAFSIPA